MNIKLILEWLEYIFKFSFKTELLEYNSALLPIMTADCAVLRDKCAHLSRFKVLLPYFA